MSATAGDAGTGSPAARLGFMPQMLLQELGWDDDVDEALRAQIEDHIGAQMVDGDVGDVVDGVLLWWRDDDGDLVDALVDALTDLADGGGIWLLTPKVGRDRHVDPADVAEAAPVAGLAITTTQTACTDWAATRLVTPRSGRKTR